MNTTIELQRSLSPQGRWGLWFPVVLATIGVGVLLAGLLSGSIGIFGDTGKVMFADIVSESGREATRLIIFSLLLLVAMRINSWRLQISLGEMKLAALRCLAIVALVEALRVAQVPHGMMRIVFIGASQYIIFTLGVLMLFSFTIREAVLFATACSVGVISLWLGSHLGTWIA